MTRISRQAYAEMYGPTVGDRVRLADTELFIEVEEDRTVYGDEVKFGGGKVIRDGMGQSQRPATEGGRTFVHRAQEIEARLRAAGPLGESMLAKFAEHGLMIETGAMMGGEESGGYGFKMHLPERDGIYADLLLLDLFIREREAGRESVSEAVAHLHEVAGDEHSFGGEIGV